MTQIVIVARYPTIRAGLASLLAGEPDLLVVAEVEDLDLLPHLIEESLPDVLLIDLVDEGTDRLETLSQLSTQGILPPAVLLSGSPDEALGALAIPRTSLLLRDATPEEIHTAARTASRGLVTLDPRVIDRINEQLEWQTAQTSPPGEVAMSPRELQVLQGIARGLPNKTIATELGISEHTVKFHVGSIFQKLDVASRSEAIAVAARQGLLVL